MLDYWKPALAIVVCFFGAVNMLSGRPVSRARTLKEFVGLMAALPAKVLEGHLLRHDFSRWIGDVFGDHALAREVRSHEHAYVQSGSVDALMRVAAAVRSRYELTG